MTTKRATFAALDQLPTMRFREVCFAARVWDAALVLRHYRQASQQRGADWAADWLRASIRAGDEDDVRDFGAKYHACYGRPWPALAADATILRYEPPRGVRLIRMRRGVAPRLRRAWEATERLLPRS